MTDPATSQAGATQDVVVTGLGALTPVGGDSPSTWSGLLAGRSGARTITEEWAQEYDLPVRISAPAAVEPTEKLQRVEARKLDRTEQLALISAREAWADAGKPDTPPERLGVVVASGTGGLLSLLHQYDVLKEKGWRRVSPFTVPMFMPNGPAGWVGLDLGATAGVHAPVSACASGAEGIAYGLQMIRSGKADVVVAGGTEAVIHPLNIAAFASMQALSRRNDEPERASRPFDKGRDGFVLGEGAGIVVLESAEHAQRRGARVYARLEGAGMSADAHHIAQPDPDGAGQTLAVERALADARMNPDEVVHVNAHATSTPQGDVVEAGAIHKALGSAAESLTVTSTKSMTGHLLGGAGAVESIAAILTLHHGIAPPTINLEDPDDEIGLDIVRSDGREVPDGPVGALNNSFGFGGHNVSLLFRRNS